jgi:prepilin-type N-terminal cleavage/methylation domain-containing protein
MVESRIESRGDRGYTLIELTISMFVFSILAAVVLTALIGLSRATSDAQARSISASGIVSVTQGLDRQVRYADSINYPGTGTLGRKYIEFRTPAASSATGFTQCTQWRFWPAEGRIETRTWRDGTTPPTAWATRMTEVIDRNVATYPFEMIPANPSGSLAQRLRITIEAGSARTGSESSLAFVARNSSVQSPSNVDANLDGSSDSPICNPTGYRP